MNNVLGSGFGLRSVYRTIILLSLLWIVSCASLPKLEAPTRSRSDLIKQTSVVSRFSIPDSKTTRAKLAKFKKALTKGKLTASDLKLHDELLETYIRLKTQADTTIEVPANSRLTMLLETYCLDSGKASPVSNEYFYWQKSKDPGIKYYQKILNFRRQQKISQKETQTLLWNLANKTNWENYPDRLKTILKSIDPQTALKLPSELRSQVIDTVADQVLQIPGASEVRDTARLIEGKFYEFDDIRRRVEGLTSAEILRSTALVPQLSKSEVFAESKSEGFEGQEVTFYNPTDEPREIDLTQYYLAPARSDVQRIGINPLIASDASLLSDLEKVLFDDMARIGIGFTPGLNDLADIFELLTGLDFVSGKVLSSFDRMLSGIGVVAGSGQAYRYVKRAVHSPVKHMGSFSDGLSRVSKRVVELTRGRLRSARQSIQSSRNIVEESRRVKPSLGNRYVRELPDLKGSLREAFDGQVFKGEYKPGEILFQAQKSGQVTPGRWFGPIKPLDADHAEAMFNIEKWGNNAGQIKTFVVKEKVSGYAGKVSGGEGHQFLIPSDIDLSKVLREVK